MDFMYISRYATGHEDIIAVDAFFRKEELLV